VPLRFGTILASKDAVAEKLLAARHDEFADALERLEGRTEFLVKGRYIEEAVLHQVLSENKKAARLQDQIQGKDSDAAQDARMELGEIFNEAVAAKRQQDTRALEHAMEGICVASAVRKPVHQLDAVRVAFLVAADKECEVERVIEDLARDWEGRIEVQLRGPMAAYDFAGIPGAHGRGVLSTATTQPRPAVPAGPTQLGRLPPPRPFAIRSREGPCLVRGRSDAGWPGRRVPQ
jgi:hypothetical protein